MNITRRYTLKRIVLLFSFMAMGSLLSGCGPMIKKAIENDPEIVFAAIKKDPKGFMDAVQDAAQKAQKIGKQQQEEDSKKQLETEFKNPKTPSIDESRVFFGPKDAVVTIVEYSDFLCPFCSRAYKTMKTLVEEKYKGKVRVLYKHLPFKQYADPAARYYEAIGMQSHEKAHKFHDYLYENQRALHDKGIAFLDAAVKKMGADLGKVKKDMKSDKVNKIMEADYEEAKKYEMSGTPGFIVGGVTVRGAFPLEHFSMIIDRRLEGK